jgi:hypothetical protein
MFGEGMREKIDDILKREGMLRRVLFEDRKHVEQDILRRYKVYHAICISIPRGIPETIVSPTKSDLLTCGVDIREIEWICESCTR